jgi:S-adenosyl methyltransferase
MPDQEQPSLAIDMTKPNIARVYDVLLDGKDNFPPDRVMAKQVLKLVPEAKVVARANRDFLRRAVRCMAGAGIRQFLDIGSGLPAQGNVHEIAQGAVPAARVVYVDNDPVVLVHARALLGSAPGAGFITGDLRRPEEILALVADRDLLDLSQPTGLLLVAILHHINDDEDPAGIAARLRAALAPGSHLAISHFCNPGPDHPEEARLAVESERLFNERLGTGRWRSRAEILAYFGGFELLAPGLVPLPAWRPCVPDPPVDGVYQRILCGVARR